MKEIEDDTKENEKISHALRLGGLNLLKGLSTPSSAQI